MFWADRIVEEIRSTRKPRNGSSFVIRDEKTLSGRVHVGSMRGAAIHGIVSEALKEQGIANEFAWEHADLDPFDTIPTYLEREKYLEHLGKPLFAVPSPEAGFANYAEYFGAEFEAVHAKSGFNPTYYRTTELYRSGEMDPLIKTALLRASDVRRILKEVSGSEKDENWLPVSVICEQCGKMMSTSASDFDGETVAYVCDRNPEDVISCGHQGRVSPFGGNAKLFWKVDWAAKWVAKGVDIEGGGKDHSTKGGSRDVANHIARDVFDFEPPYDIPYEFFLVAGKKMSSSKGKGASAKEMSDLFPSQVFRLLLIGKDINQQIDIDPAGESVPRLYDWYDELAENVRQGKADDYSRLYALCELPPDRAGAGAPWQMRFREVAFIEQMPHLDLKKEAESIKQSELREEEIEKLSERAEYAKFWLSTYAPPEFKYELQQHLPSVELSDAQKNALEALLSYLSAPRTGEEIHARLHELKSEIPIAPPELFRAIYRIFLNRDSGPKAGWFLAGLPHEFVIKRLSEAVK